MEFQGLQNSLPGIITISLAFLICILAWYSYKNYSSISSRWKVLLSTLRALSLIILLLLFLNPFFKNIERVQINPKIAILLDGSVSTSIEKGGYSGLSDYQEVIAQLRNVPDDVDLEFFSFGNSVKLQDPSSFTSTQTSTNLYDAIETVTTSNSEYVSAVLISDGIITSGKNPVIQSGNSPFPIHVIGLGDTSKVKDISIQNITTNATGFTETLHSVNVDIAQFGFANQTLSINLASGDQLIESKNVTLNSDREIETVNFDLPLNTDGLKQYSIIVNPVPGEWTNENNTSTFSIEVLDSKKRVFHIASAIHPDVKALRSILIGDENIELSTYTYLGTRPALKELLNEDSDFDLIIVHGVINEAVAQELSLSELDVSTLLVLLPNQVSSELNSSFELIESNPDELFNVQFSGNSNNLDHPVLDLPELDLSSLAPVQSSINSSLIYPESITLLENSYQNIPTNSPVLSLIERGNKRISQLNATGWYKMYLSQNSSERDYITKLISNIVDWTSSNPDNRLLKVNPTKSTYSSAEIPIINASLLNETGEVESSGIVEITIDGENFTSDFTMKNLNNGNYQLQAPNLPEGKYSFTATARKGNRDIDTQTGEFLISESNIELANTIRNDDLLIGIAGNSNGIFTDFTESNNFWDNKSISSTLVQRTEIQEKYLFPVRSVYWFFVVLILLGTEWLLRKKYALP